VVLTRRCIPTRLDHTVQMNNTYSCGRQISVHENGPTPCKSGSMSDIESDVFY